MFKLWSKYEIHRQNIWESTRQRKLISKFIDKFKSKNNVSVIIRKLPDRFASDVCMEIVRWEELRAIRWYMADNANLIEVKQLFDLLLRKLLTP